MKKKVYFMKAISLAILCALILGGCSDNSIKEDNQTITEIENTTDIVSKDTLKKPEIIETD